MLLQVKELNTFYGASHVLQGISLEVNRGEIVGLLGRNGMGKSTTLKSIMGVARPRSGAVIFDGQNITGYQPFQAAQVGLGWVPEERRIFPTLSVLDNLMLGIKGGRGPITDNENHWTIDRIFDQFPSLKRRAGNKGAHLSGGEQQMLAIGRALMGNPKLLMVDEPTEGLAPLIVRDVQEVLARINQAGVSILLVEHNLKVAMALSHRIYLMGKAHIGFNGTVELLNSQPEIKAKYLEV